MTGFCRTTRKSITFWTALAVVILAQLTTGKCSNEPVGKQLDSIISMGVQMLLSNDLTSALSRPVEVVEIVRYDMEMQGGKALTLVGNTATFTATGKYDTQSLFFLISLPPAFLSPPAFVLLSVHGDRILRTSADKTQIQVKPIQGLDSAVFSDPHYHFLLKGSATNCCIASRPDTLTGSMDYYVWPGSNGEPLLDDKCHARFHLKHVTHVTFTNNRLVLSK